MTRGKKVESVVVAGGFDADVTESKNRISVSFRHRGDLICVATVDGAGKSLSARIDGVNCPSGGTPEHAEIAAKALMLAARVARMIVSGVL